MIGTFKQCSVTVMVLALLAGGLNTSFAEETNSPLATNLLQLDKATRQAQWRWLPNDGDTIEVDKLLEKASDEHPLVLDAVAKLAETEAKEEEVTSRRLMYLFRYFDARQMENSAELDIKAAAAQLEAARQKALKQTIKHYADWVSASGGSAASYAYWQVAHAEKRYAEGQFEQGAITGIELNNATSNWVVATSMADKANRQRRQACIPLQALLDADDIDDDCALEEVTFVVNPRDEPEWDSSDRQAAREGLAGLLPNHVPLDGWMIGQPERPVTVAFEKRPDLKAITYREEAIERLVKASNIFEMAQKKVLKAAKERVETARKQLEVQIRAEVQLAKEALQSEQQQVALATVNRQLAARSWHQARVAIVSGLLSEREGLALEAAYVKARAEELAANMELLKVKANYLFATGQLNLSSGLVN